VEYSFTRHVTIGGDEDKKEAIEYAYSKEGQEVIGLALHIAIVTLMHTESPSEDNDTIANMQYLLEYVFPRDNKENK
tara:strand:- start:237 stop:467 length:231 start_codon:yes stop_codon:yes gene_type:complete